ncbi:MAG: hypothetical protein WDO16_23810 [Bacteroidota bacterium]
MRKVNLCCLFLMPLTLLAQGKIRFDQAPASPQVFAENQVSTGFNERDFTLSPDGTELFYSIQSPKGVFQSIIYRQRNSSGNWSEPVLAPFAGKFSDIEAAFSPDGKKLFFSSNRPLSGTVIKDFDIWVVEKKNGKWGEPENLGSPINTEADEFYPSITRSGNLYFTAAYKKGVGKEDIYIAKWENGKYNDPVAMDTAVNSKAYEFNAFVSPGEDFIIFTAYGRSDDKGQGDLYISLKNDSGKWQPAKNLSLLNSPKLDYCPFVSFDKKILFFTSERNTIKSAFTEQPAKLNDLLKSFSSPLNGGGDIYWISFEKVLESVKE